VAEPPFGIRLRGMVAWSAWLGLHLLHLVGFRDRATVLLDRTYDYLTYDRAARPILDPRQRGETTGDVPGP
jgi:NADH dehydrogenase